MFPIYQTTGNTRAYFSYGQGRADGRAAHDTALGYGFNPGTGIYFACDDDATQDEIESLVVPHYEGVQVGLRSKGKRYVHGVHGSRNVCADVSRTTPARAATVRRRQAVPASRR